MEDDKKKETEVKEIERKETEVKDETNQRKREHKHTKSSVGRLFSFFTQ
jgi:hypothetical protein